MSTQSPKRYHQLHVALHWLIALLVIIMLGIGKFIMPGVPAEGLQKVLMLQSHAYIGGAIAVLLIIRLFLRFTTKRPATADAGNAFLNFIGRATHFLSYLLLIGMAVSGLGLFQLADLPAVFTGEAPYPANFIQYLPRMGHGITSNFLLLLVILHVGAALYHQFFRRDNLLARMWFGESHDNHIPRRNG